MTRIERGHSWCSWSCLLPPSSLLPPHSSLLPPPSNLPLPGPRFPGSGPCAGLFTPPPHPQRHETRALLTPSKRKDSPRKKKGGVHVLLVPLISRRQPPPGRRALPISAPTLLVGLRYLRASSAPTANSLCLSSLQVSACLVSRSLDRSEHYSYSIFGLCQQQHQQPHALVVPSARPACWWLPCSFTYQSHPTRA
jgi:hypothetical protein